jgi:hypothetical protein
MRWSHLAVCVAVGAAAIVSPGTSMQAAQSRADREEMRDTFLQRVDAYVRLHREIERLLPPEVVTSDLERLFAPRIAMNREMRQAGSTARQGDIFTPGVSVYFRVLIAETLRRNGIVDALAALEEEEDAVVVPATVNGDYPAGRSVALMPPCLIGALPPLPPEVRYGFIGTDLILWDLHAGLIVDFVPRALPVVTVAPCQS